MRRSPKCALRIKIKLFVIALLLPILPHQTTDESSAAPSFDCSAARTDVEKAICRNRVLAISDQQMSDLYYELNKTLSDSERTELIEQQRSWLKERNRCRDDVQCLFDAYEDRIVQLEWFDRTMDRGRPTSDRAKVLNCDREQANVNDFASDIDVFVSAPTEVKANTKLSVSWKASIGNSPKIPTYIIIDFPSATRFEGKGFLPLTADATAPHEINHMKSRVRAFIPLHREGSSGNGSFSAIPLRAGATEIGWSVITSGSCGEKRHRDRATFDLQVNLGKPTLVVQDRFASEAPNNRIRDNSGTYDLLIYDERYEVRIARTGERIFERAGVSPNFSPTARFVVAQNPTTQDMEIVDLLSGGVEHTIFQGLIGWARNDSIIIYSGSILGRFALFASLSEESGFYDLGGGASMNSNSWHSTLKLNIDQGYIYYKDDNKHISYDMSSERYAVTNRIGETISGNSDRMKNVLRENMRRQFSDEQRHLWQLGEKLKISNVQHFHGGYNDEKIVQEQRSYFVEHERVNTFAFENRLMKSEEVTGRALTRGFQAVGTSSVGAFSPDIIRQALTRISDEVLPLGEDFPIVHHSFDPPLFSEPDQSHRAAVRPLIRKIIKIVPSATRAVDLQPGNFQPGMTWNDECRVPFDIGHVKSIWEWGGEGNSHYLIHSQCFAGSLYVSHGSLLLVSERGSPQVRDITRELFPDPEIDDAGPLGFWTVENIKLVVTPVDDRFFLLGSSATNHFGVLDSRTMRRFGQMIPAERLDLTASVRMSKDRKHLLVLYSDQTFEISRIRDGSLVISGAFVDGEVVVMLPDGRYDASFEGAEAIQVQFEGLSGLHTIHQFRTLLHRPNLASNVIRDRRVAAPPSSIGEPPSAQVKVTGIEHSSSKRTVEVTARSSSNLSLVQIFLDGKLIEERDISGTFAQLQLAVDDPGGARWVTVVAFDASGLASRPISVALPGQSSPRGNLRAILVGVDNYSLINGLSPLDAAAADANHLRDALVSTEGKVYEDVQTAMLLNSKASKEHILDSLRAAAEATRAEDTLLFMFSGHGVDPSRLGGDGELTLALHDTRVGSLSTTGVSWSQIASVLGESRGRVIILLDACHSGAAGRSALSQNDDIARALLTKGDAPVVVISASKGQQLSYERADRKGGYFSYALASAITRDRSMVDKDQNDLVDLGEIYSFLKSEVSRTTESQIGVTQTPWLARNALVGNMALF